IASTTLITMPTSSAVMISRVQQGVTPTLRSVQRPEIRATPCTASPVGGTDGYACRAASVVSGRSPGKRCPRSAAGGFALAEGMTVTPAAHSAYVGSPLVGHAQQRGNVPYRQGGRQTGHRLPDRLGGSAVGPFRLFPCPASCRYRRRAVPDLVPDVEV